jgi:hypothetical protein
MIFRLDSAKECADGFACHHIDGRLSCLCFCSQLVLQMSPCVLVEMFFVPITRCRCLSPCRRTGVAVNHHVVFVSDKLNNIKYVFRSQMALFINMSSLFLTTNQHIHTVFAFIWFPSLMALSINMSS